MSREQLLLDFIPEAFDLIQDSETAILEIEELWDNGGSYNEELINNLFRYFHTLKGSAGLLKLETIVQVTHEAETLLDILRKEAILPSAHTCQILINTCDQLRKLFQVVEATKANPDLEEESLTLIEALQGEIKSLGKTKTGSKQKNTYEIFDSTEDKKSYEIFNDPAPKVIVKASYEIFEDSPVAKNETTQKIQVQPERENLTGVRSSLLKKEIKVSNEKLDALMDLMGELVIAESNVTQHAVVKRLKNDDFHLSLNRLRKIVADLQEVAFSTRMIPISGVFQRMSRLIRDLQKKSMKKVSLYISGEDTEIDKSIVDLIADPIIHILRNSIDHGIESPDDRLAVMKSEEGNIYLSAKQSVNEVWIMIRDDGKGLDRDRIIAKAIENGILTTDPNLLTDKEVFQLIFAPGLSTAKEVTDLSGRGVGMDIVKQNIEKLGGKIDIHSKQGLGTTFILRIPLTLGIMEGTVVRIGDKYFTIQTIELREFVSLSNKEKIRLDEGQMVIDVRGKFIPVFDMNQVLNHRIPLEYDGTDLLTVIIEHEGSLFGIQVDEIIGNYNVVIKPLHGLMENAAGVSGFTILGSGNVSLILDVKSIYTKLHDVVR
ncbi:chemotaxis protein CheA [Leptospira kobayashii]|uniref:Chemotaxis protein CheA n=1 Tax=Leptospira kobayashii TaxID=1917830 RepID=A0ABN6KEL0_9LEPT|nr:chemotaxis protein CheA [Leptospira kobayashii]BDA78033.1 chemotaxis protein CheA [Leptospira kobayashii]